MTESSEEHVPRLRVRGLRKVYRKKVVANDGISLEIRSGEVFGLLGPNGAGKTTLVNQVIGLLAPTEGAIEVDGIDVVAKPDAARHLCSYLPQGPLPIGSFTLEGAVEMAGLIRGGSRAAVRKRLDDLVDALELAEWRRKLGTRLSGGVRRLIGFAMAAVWPGRLVILDEPTNDVDPIRRRLLWRLIRRLADQGAAVLLVTHNVLEAERAVDRLAVLDRGHIVAEGTPAALRNSERSQLLLRLTLDPGAGAVTPPPFAARATRAGRRLLAALPEAEALEAVRWASEQRRAGLVEDYELGPVTLEDTYARFLGRADLRELEEGRRG